jgi:cellulose synthase/poly-beta-1,6-N-acetylglucosamine synthase-like glycosyltransferase
MPSLTLKDDAAEQAPLLSIVIGVYNDWAPLEPCLQSLSQQVNAPAFEVIVVDDGSNQAAPEFIRAWARFYPLTIVEQSHAGISAARNRGIQSSRGLILLFTDADCKFRVNCLAHLASVIADSPQHNCFQLHLVGDCSGLVGRAEELRLITLQKHLLQPDGCIRYLNTAGFGLRRARADIEMGVFDPSALRAEDTLLLANLIQNGELPLFVPSAIVEHVVPLSLLECLHKDLRSAYLGGKTYNVIASKGVRIRVSHRERRIMVLSMWRTSGQRSIGRLAWFVAVARQTLRLIASSVCRWL